MFDAFRPPAWVADAHCAETSIPDAWFSESWDERKYAKQVCGGCPVKRQCLDRAIACGERAGIWGGISFDPKKSRGARRDAKKAAA